MLTVLMIFDVLVAIILIAAILGQEAKSAGMGGLDGGGDTVLQGARFGCIFGTCYRYFCRPLRRDYSCNCQDDDVSQTFSSVPSGGDVFYFAGLQCRR